jgi:hypothetical protein
MTPWQGATAPGRPGHWQSVTVTGKPERQGRPGHCTAAEIRNKCYLSRSIYAPITCQKRQPESAGRAESESRRLVQNVEVLVKSVPGGGPFLDHEENLSGNGEVFPLDIASGELDMHTV